MPYRIPFFCILGVLFFADAAAFDLVYRLPAERSVQADTSLAYGGSDASLRLDLYRPAGADARSPAVIYFNGGVRSAWRMDYPVAWCRLIAASGFPAVSYGSTRETAARDFEALLRYLRARGPELKLDGEHVAVVAASGNAFTFLPLLMTPEPARESVRAAVFLYGSAAVDDPRTDVPMLFVRAGLDEPGSNEQFDAFVTRALSRNAPITVVNLPGAHHPFEATDDDAMSRAGIAEVLAFLHAHASGATAEAVRADSLEIRAMGAMAREDWNDARELFARLARSAPDNPEFERRIADASYEAGDYSEAALHYDQAAAKHHPSRGVVAVGGLASTWRSGNRRKAEVWATQLRNVPWTRAMLQANPRIADLWSDPEFARLMERAAGK